MGPAISPATGIFSFWVMMQKDFFSQEDVLPVRSYWLSQLFAVWQQILVDRDFP